MFKEQCFPTSAFYISKSCLSNRIAVSLHNFSFGTWRPYVPFRNALAIFLSSLLVSSELPFKIGSPYAQATKGKK
jgi:hypothetical protein